MAIAISLHSFKEHERQDLQVIPIASKAPVKRSQLFMQQHATFVVKKNFVPFDHLVVCCCFMLHVVVSCCMKFAGDQKCL